jgi:hypothetical protein
MWNLLNEAAKTRPVAGNKDGSYLTMKSNCWSSILIWSGLSENVSEVSVPASRLDIRSYPDLLWLRDWYSTFLSS